MNRPLAAVWLIALVAVFAIFAFSMHQTSPEPFALPPTMAAVTPIGTHDDVLHVLVDNLPTAVPAPTRGLWQTPTSAVPSCPGTDGELCQVVAVPMVAPTTVIAPCSTETIATFVPGDICRWADVTPIPTTERMFWK